MMGMSSPEWSSCMARELGVPIEPAAISAETVARVAVRRRQSWSRTRTWPWSTCGNSRRRPSRRLRGGVPPRRRSVELVQPMRLAPIGAASGAMSGSVLGMLLLEPVVFAAVGAVAGAAGAGLSALGLNQWFLREVGETLEPGRAALFVVANGAADPERVIEALQPLAPRLLRATLDPAAEQRLLAAFTETAPEPGFRSQSPPGSE
jgi:uncharacterized membrane protein